jgi:hypothetical protein
VIGVASLKVVLSDGLLHDGVCIGCARVDIRDKLSSSPAVPPCALVSCCTSALLEDEWGRVQAVASMSLRLLDLGPSVLPHLIAVPLQQVRASLLPPTPLIHKPHLSSQPQVDHHAQLQPPPPPSSGDWVVGRGQAGDERRMRDVAVAAEDTEMDHRAMHSRPQPLAPACNSRCDTHAHAHPHDNGSAALHQMPADSISHAPPPPVKDNPTIWGSAGAVPQQPQPPPLFLSKA